MAERSKTASTRCLPLQGGEEGLVRFVERARTILAVDRRMAKIEERLRALLKTRGITEASVPGVRTRKRT